MKLVKQTKLHFKDSKSDKTYEVDLCDAGNDTYLVNFRYGRTGKNLKEGTKTTHPISIALAEIIFNKLVAEKTKKGYNNIADKVSVPTVSAIAAPIAINLDEIEDVRERAILGHLKLAIEDPAAQVKKNWNIKRVMWRAGELKIKSALPYLMQLHDAGDSLHIYSALWAMGRCGADASAAPILDQYLNGAYPDNIKNISKAILLQVLKGSDKEKFVKSILSKIPPVFKARLDEGNPDSFKAILNEYIHVKKTKKFDFLIDIYLLINEFPQIRSVVNESLKTIPFKPPFFKYVRSIFKLSEFKGDGQIYGMLAYRFEKENFMFHKSRYSAGVWAAGGWIADVEKELKKDNPKIAYSSKTKAYMNRRIWKWLNKLTDEQDLDYVKIAAGLLLSYDEKDYSKPTKDVRWNYNSKTRRYDKKTVNYDSFSDKLFLNYILYANSSRYEYIKDRKRWKCAGTYRPGMPTPKEREEACPELWDKMPRAYIHLLAESNIAKIHEFALRAFQQHKEYLPLKNKINTDLIIRFIEKKYNPTALWALELAKEKYDPKNPNRPLSLAMLSSQLKKARELAKEWIKENYDFYFSNTDFIVSMMLHKHVEIRKWAKKDMPTISKKLTTAQKQVLTGRIISYLLGLKNKKHDNPTVKYHTETLITNFSPLLKSLGFNIIKDLVKHPLEENQKFAGHLILNHETPAENIPADLFNLFLHSQKPELRTIGIQLFGQFSDNTLLGKQDDLVKYATSRLEDIRQAVKPVIKRLATKHASFAEDCVNKFVPVLLRKETYEGVHQDTFDLLTNELENYLKIIDRKKIFRLLNSEHGKAQELGTVLVDKYIDAETLSIPNIIRLGNHEIKACREISWRMYKENLSRIRYERDEAIRIMDSTWDDTRAFAFDFFREEFREKDWTPQLLVSICDSTKLDVQTFGRELITKYFEEENGTEYLLKLSQHPRIELQLFASNYLERFASDDLNKLQQLEFYFVTVLSQVNKGRVAKDRVLNFLRNEAMKLPEAAEIVARILDRLSMTAAIGDKSTSIEIMRDIHDKYPHIKMPISLVN